MPHRKVAPGSEAKASVGRAFEMCASVPGPDEMAVSGAVRSTTKVRVAGGGSVFVAASMARTAKVCAPSGSLASWSGELQLANGPLSSEHSKVAPASEENAKVASRTVAPAAGPESIAV